MRVLVAVQPADFRRGIDGLARTCRAALGSDPFSGTVFVFRNKRKTAVKVLVYDGHGFWRSSGPRGICTYWGVGRGPLWVSRGSLGGRAHD